MNTIKGMLVKCRNITNTFVSVLLYSLMGQEKKNKEILSYLENKYEGKRCFIVCNGPSLTPGDLTKIHENGDVSFAMNAIARIYNETPWRPTFLSLTDDIAFTKKNRKMCKDCEATYKFYNKTRYMKSLSAKGKKFYLSFDESMELLNTPRFDTNVFKKIASIGTSCYGVLELAIFMGFKEIYIIGCDMSYAVNIDKEGNIFFNDSGKEHFYGKDVEDIDTKKVAPIPTWQMEVAFDTAENYAKENGVHIYNATRGGLLKSFSRIEFDSLFPD